MKKFRKPRCPFCGEKTGFFNAWALKTQGEFQCPKCGRISNIVLDRTIYPAAFLTVLIGCVLFGLYFFGALKASLWSFLPVAAPFFLFFILSVFFVRLKKPPVRRRPVRPPGPGAGRGRPPC
jgi:uncharacterized protein (DUF983 family)